MKLKELHIRNIASIEKADIDFEKGLNDAITGTPASIFLISGDTGAGKSVILDCISMALYKKTPRIEGVANKKENKFENNEGTTIQVNSIEQYTRLGISEKDECYSEVVFEGNDGKNYHARLELGMSKSHTKDEQGIYILKYSTPSWTYKTDEQDWTKDNIEKAILHAVGLTYEQFGRMAMLAQGQFANFLTGDKKEREAILEQLTNTKIFTDYGMAISNLWRKAKETQTVLQTKYDTEKPHTLTDEEAEQLTKGIKVYQDQKDEIDRKIKALDDQLKQIEIVLNNEQAQEEALQKKQELEAIIASEEYLRNKALFTDWDTTTDQRQQLTNLLIARQGEQEAQNGLLLAQATFNHLSADLADRKAKLEALNDAILKTTDWIGQRKQHEELFNKAGETDLIIDQYLTTFRKVAELAQSLKEERDKTKGLKTVESEANAKAQKAYKEVQDQQDIIDDLIRQRKALNPEVVNEQIDQKQNSKKSLEKLNDKYTALDAEFIAADKLREEINGDEDKLKTLNKSNEEAEVNYKARKAESDKANKRLTTMQMSLNDTIVELRHRLHKEHTDICPLCGQAIDHDHLDDDFKGILTPLEQEQEQSDKALKTATEKRDEAKSALNIFEGELKGKKDKLAVDDKKNDQTKQEIENEATQLGLNIHEPLAVQIESLLQTLENELTKLKETQKEAEKLQGDINKLLEEKRPLDEIKNKADTAKTNAENAVKTNAEEITRLEEEHQKEVQESDDLKTKIDQIIVGYCENWQSDTESVRQKLKTDAKEFNDHQKQLDSDLKKQERDTNLFETLSKFCQKILLSCPEWETESEPKAYPCNDIQTEWTTSLTRVTSLVSKQNECKKNIAELSKALSAYYQASGKTEQVLQALIANESQIANARQFVNDADSQLSSRKNTIEEAQKQIDAAIKKLNITNRSELPDKQQIEEEKKTTNGQRDDILGKLGEIKKRLDDNKENNDRLKEIENDFAIAKQQFARWDRLNAIFGGTRFRTLVQTYILRPLLNNANIYLEQITDRYLLTCSEDNEQLSILVLDRYNKNQVRSVTVLSGGERFMISLALSLALSSLPRPDKNINILFIDEGFGTLDEKSLNSVMSTLEKLQEIAGQTNRRVGIISHREELDERIPVQIHLDKKGEGRSIVEIKNSYF